MSASVTIDRVWKSYPRWAPGVRTLRAIVGRRMPALMHFGEQRWALRDVSLTLEPGESVGVIGPNGAGKSTLLRLASGLARPTRGRIEMPANAAAILSLGDIFDLTLTGRENALTGAIVAGMTRAQARACMPEILEFAELEDWGDAPVRVYSEGMKLRLVFGVLAQLDPEALLIDEVLAVGDFSFQRKCLEHIATLRGRGTTLVLASHDLDQVRSQCDRAVWLDGGTVRSVGAAETVVQEYRDEMMARTLSLTPSPGPGAAGELELGRNRFGSQEVRIDTVALLDRHGREVAELEADAPLTVRLGITAPAGGVPGLIAAVSVHRARDGLKCCDATTAGDGVTLDPVAGPTALALHYDRLGLEPDEYEVEVGVWASGWRYAYDLHRRAYPLRIVGERRGEGVLRAPGHWEVHAAESQARDD
jgi:ABC-type polysaccharide/polyol phosphate transport system ATPase subunit